MEFWDDIEYFVAEEFNCLCCGENNMKHSFMLQLDHLRGFCGFPFVISSGYRCPEYNDRVSSTGKTGPHTTGRAADILVSGSRTHALLINLHRVSITGVGVAQKGDHATRFIHVDTLDHGDTRPTCWSY